jgi:hypothetical protein
MIQMLLMKKEGEKKGQGYKARHAQQETNVNK